MSRETIELEIFRYNPETDSKPSFELFEVPYHEDWLVLDAINYVKDHLDRSLSYRWSCHMAVCGSCGMMCNGEPTLTCKSFLRDYPGSIRIEPLANFPVERDLIVDQDDFMAKLASVKPYIIDPDEPPLSEGEYLQTPKQLALFSQYTGCINCLLCYSACPQYSLAEGFIGPAALTMAFRYNQDSRDHGFREREPQVGSNDGVWQCSFVGACSEVCPKGVDPAAAIQQGKIASAAHYFKKHLMPWSES
jgi:fumarate reductase iron-sulfur subunit